MFGLFASLLVCLFVCLLVGLLVCWFVCLFVCLFACLLACLFVCLFVCLLGCLFVCLLVCLLACLLACLFVSCLFKFDSKLSSNVTGCIHLSFGSLVGAATVPHDATQLFTIHVRVCLLFSRSCQNVFSFNKRLLNVYLRRISLTLILQFVQHVCLSRFILYTI